ncbi:MAG: DUF3322 domain-containing protein [Proteobacteria bacterium]|jgi:hypothetical protein|nr:DUF3322 domain-containing protein [Pseudomonadota bacterium]
MSAALKGPAELATQLRRQWADTPRRLRQLLNEPGAWPVTLPIPWPEATQIEHELDAVRQHVQRWRAVTRGQVQWAERRYRATGQAVALPRAWELRGAEEWVEAMGDRAISNEYVRFQHLAGLPELRQHPEWLPVLVRQRQTLAGAELSELARAVAVATQLSPGCAHGLPLRALPQTGVDSKFWERQRTLLGALLEASHPGQVVPVGLEAFLHADPSGAHWLDVVDLDGGLLPWPRLRVRADDLGRQALPGQALLLVENHQCLHHLPPAGSLPGTLAVLGAGLDLAWLAAPGLRGRRVAYWGDIDSWGLVMLARARQLLPDLRALLMDAPTWRRFGALAGAEPLPASGPPEGLLPEEQALWDALRAEPARARLEQERLPVAEARAAILEVLLKI